MSNKVSIEYVTKEVINKIIESSGKGEGEVVDEFLASKTYDLICNQDLDIWMMPPYALYEIYLTEKNGVSPLESKYIGGQYEP